MAPFCWHTQDKRLTISPSLLGKAESNTGTYISLYQFVFWIMLALSYVIATDVINVRAALVTRWRHMSRHGSHITVTAAVTVTLIHKWTYCPRHTNLLSSAHQPIRHPMQNKKKCNSSFYSRLFSGRKQNSGGTLLVAQLVEALRYKPEGRGFDSRWCH